MENFFPNNGTVDLRNGYVEHATVSVGSIGVHALAEYNKSDGTSKFIGFGSFGDPYDITSGGAGTNISGALTYGIQPYTLNFAGRIFLKGAESTDDVYDWTGTGDFTASGFTGPSGDDKLLRRIASYKSRLYFTASGSASIWYGGVNAITGTLTEYDFSTLLMKGGTLWFIGSYSGNYYSPQELFVVISSEGEVLLWQGDYPGSISWNMIGHFFIPQPASNRAFFNWGTDILIITKEGLLSLSNVLGTSGQGSYTYLSENIASVFNEFASQVVNDTDVAGIHYPAGNYILINFLTGSNSVQFIMNTISKAWCKFTNQNSRAWSLFNGDLYFGKAGNTGGQAGHIFKANTGYFDDNGSGGALSRTIKLRSAYNFFGDPYSVKQFTEAIPYIYMSEGLSLTMDADVDFANTTPTSTETDLTDTSYKLYTPSMGLNGVGNCASIRIDQTVTTKRMSLQAIKVFWNEGGEK